MITETSATTEPASSPASEGCNRIPSSFVQTDVVTVGAGVRIGVGTGENEGVGSGGGIGVNVGLGVSIAVGTGDGVDRGVGVVPVSFSTVTITFAFRLPALNTILAMPFFLAVIVNLASPFASVTSFFDDKDIRFLFLLILAVTLIPSGRSPLLHATVIVITASLPSVSDRSDWSDSMELTSHEAALFF